MENKTIYTKALTRRFNNLKGGPFTIEELENILQLPPNTIRVSLTNKVECLDKAISNGMNPNVIMQVIHNSRRYYIVHVTKGESQSAPITDIYLVESRPSPISQILETVSA